jgi:hypothetical protein
MRVAHIIAIGTLAVPVAMAQSQRPPMPRVRAQPCTGYCNTIWASCQRAALRAAPAESAPVVASVDSGQLVHVIAGERRTTRPGIVVVRQTFTLVQRLSTADEDYTPPHPKRWRLKGGDTVYVVDTDTDGDSYTNYIWVYRGHENTTAAFWHDTNDESTTPIANAQLMAEIEQRWWARVRTSTGTLGWTAPGSEWSGTSYYDEPLARCVRAGRSKK